MADNRFLFSSSKFLDALHHVCFCMPICFSPALACLSPTEMFPQTTPVKCSQWSNTDSAPPHGCRQDTHIPSIVFITLQLPNTVLPFTDPRQWMGELFKCFPFESNACSVFTPKTLLLNLKSEVDSRHFTGLKKSIFFFSLKKKNAFPAGRRCKVLSLREWCAF